MARRGHSAGGTSLGHVPPEFAELFAGAKDHELVPRLHSWLAQKYGSAFADLFWLVELAAKGDRESVRLDAIVRLQTIFYGEAPQTLLVEQKETNGASAPIRAPSLHHIGKVFDVLRTVGALPSAGEASRTRGSADAEVEQVPPADAGPARMG